MKYIIESPTNSSISFDSRFSFSNLNDEWVNADSSNLGFLNVIPNFFSILIKYK